MKQQNDGFDIQKVLFVMFGLLIVVAIMVFAFADKPSTNGSNGTNPSNTGTKVAIDGDPAIGDKNKATVYVVEFSDLECPACKTHATGAMEDIKTTYIDTGKIVWVTKYMPLSQHEPMASVETEAVLCVFFSKGSSDDYHKVSQFIFSKTLSNGNGMPITQLYDYIASIGYNKDDIKKCVDDKKYQDIINKNEQQASQVGLQATPSFLIGKLDGEGKVDGKMVVGTMTLDGWKSALDNAINQ